jgi:hypothetical protein
MEAQHGVRYRVNVATSTKGYHSYDATVEITQDYALALDLMADEMEEEGVISIRTMILAESDALVAALEARYPNGERAL